MNQHPNFFTPVADYYLLARPCDWDNIFRRKEPIELEIGFGYGEVLIRQAQENPARNYIGIEQQWQRFFRALKTIDQVKKGKQDSKALSNISLLNCDARDVLARHFLPKTIDHVYCLFPCPWPKAKHEKHRLFSTNFLKLLNSRLKEKGILRVVTDSQAFARWMEGQAKGSGFSVAVTRIDPSFNTKFERKWKREGRSDYFEVEFQKTRHLSAPVPKDITMKAFKAKAFHPEKFQLQEVTGNPSVIFKDMLFDPEKKRAMVHVIVSEDHLIQHLWVTIAKKDQFWRIYKTDGQQFLPTPGVAKAIEVVYEAVERTAS